MPSSRASDLPARLAERYRREICQQHQPGDRLPTQRDVAAAFGVSLGTAREALRMLEHEGLIRRRWGSGFYLAERPPRPVGLVCGLGAEQLLRSFYFARLLDAVQRFLRERQMPVRLYLSAPERDADGHQAPPPELLRDLEADELAAVVAIALPAHSHWVEQAAAQGLPMIGDRSFPFGFRTDLPQAIGLATRLLLNSGRTRLAYLGWHERPDADCLLAFHEMHSEFGLEADPRRVICDLDPLYFGAGWSEFREIWAGSGEAKPDALVISDDALLLDAAGAIRELGVRVPEDLLVVSLANRGAPFTPVFPLASIEFDPDELAETWGEMLLELLAGRTPDPTHPLLRHRWRDPDELLPTPAEAGAVTLLS